MLDDSASDIYFNAEIYLNSFYSNAVLCLYPTIACPNQWFR